MQDGSVWRRRFTGQRHWSELRSRQKPEAPVNVDELHGVEFKAGVHKGRSFKMVYAYEKTYVKGIISKHANDNIKDVQFAKYCMGRQAEETGSAYMVHDSEIPDELYVILDTGCNNTCHGSRWMDKFKNYMGMQPELMALDG